MVRRSADVRSGGQQIGATMTTIRTRNPVLLLERLSAQAMIAKAFQSVFGVEPSAEQFQILRSPVMQSAFRLVEAPGSTGARDSLAFFAFLDEGQGESIDHLKSEYTRLFIGPARLPAPPWESAYRGEDRLLLQSSTLEIRELYRSLGVIPSHYPTVADDHVSLELAFLHHAAQRAQVLLMKDEKAVSPALAFSISAMVRIIDGHLLAWMPAFSHDLTNDDPRGYYAVSARLLLRFLNACSRFLQELGRPEKG